jgi:hypothetical protein
MSSSRPVVQRIYASLWARTHRSRPGEKNLEIEIDEIDVCYRKSDLAS